MSLSRNSAGVGGNGFVTFFCAIQSTAEYAMTLPIALMPTSATPNARAKAHASLLTPASSEPWSRETRMDRAADNHYPTSFTEAIDKKNRGYLTNRTFIA